MIKLLVVAAIVAVCFSALNIKADFTNIRAMRATQIERSIDQ